MTLALSAGVFLSLLGVVVAGAAATLPRRRSTLPAPTSSPTEVDRAASTPTTTERAPAPSATDAAGPERSPTAGLSSERALELAEVIGTRALVAAQPFATHERTTLDESWQGQGVVGLRLRARGTDRRSGQAITLKLRWSFDRSGTTLLEATTGADADLPPVATTAVRNLFRASLHPLAVRTLLEPQAGQPVDARRTR